MEVVSCFWHGVPVELEIDITDYDDGFDVAVDKIIVGGVNIQPIICMDDEPGGLLEQINNIADELVRNEFDQNAADARIAAIEEWKGYEH